MEQVKKSNKKAPLIFSWILVFLWMGFIFYMSAQDSTSSSGFSTPIAESVAEYQLKFGLINVGEYSSSQYLINLESDIRMIAHSTVFFVLSVLVSMAMLASGIKKGRVLILSITLSLLYAFADEFHQFFVPGRASEMLDIYLDTLGILLGTALTVLASGIVGKRRKKSVSSESDREARAERKQEPSKPVVQMDATLKNDKVLTFKSKVKSAPKETLYSKEDSNVKSAAAAAIKPIKVKERDIVIAVWMKFGFSVSFSVLCAIISSNVNYMPIIAMASLGVMLAITFKAKFLENNIKKISISWVFISVILALFTVISIYASFRLVANAYISEQGTVIEDFYYNFIRSSLTAFSLPAVIALWYIALDKAKKLIKHIQFNKLEVMYIGAFIIMTSAAIMYVYARTNVFYAPGNNNIIFSLDSTSIISEFSYTNFTSVINTLFQPVFSLGALPFGVVAKMLSYPLTFIPGYGMDSAEALGISVVNAFMLAVSILIFSRTINLKNRAFFIVIISVSFPVAFALLLPSSGVVALLYMAVFVYILIKTDFDYAPVLAVLSCAFLPFAAIPIVIEKKKNNIKSLARAYMYIALCVLLCSDFINFREIASTIKHVPRIMESALSMIGFFAMSIFAPIGASASSPYYIYEYAPSSYIYIMGAVVALAAFIGFLIKRREQYAKIAFLCAGVGVVFSLYFVAALSPSGIIAFLIVFSWATVSLIHMLAEKILSPGKWPFKAIMTLAALIIAVYNLKILRDIVVFAFNYYPR